MENIEKTWVIYQFGKFTLNPKEKTLSAEGKPIHLPAKEFETLLLLVQNNGHALSKQQMIQIIWQESFVEEVNLAKQISRLRKIFNSNGNKLIETLPKHGYRFTADVKKILPPAEETILEKHTIKRLTLHVEDETDDTLITLSSTPKSLFRYVWAFGLILLVLSLIVLVWFQSKTVKTVKEDAISVLTDGQFDDTGAIWTNQGKVFFNRYITNTRIETWQMNANGSDQRRANAEIKDLQNGRWSPDGKKVLFIKEGDNKTLYLADATGANEIVLPVIPGNMDWSPDSSQFVYQGRDSTARSHDIFLYTVKTGKKINLTYNDTSDADPSFSYDGKHVAFTSFRDGNAEIYVMKADGSDVKRVTNHPAFDNYPVFSPDGTKIAFQSNRENERTEIYLQNLNNELPPIKISNLHGETGISPKCWSADGTEIFFWNDQNGKARIIQANLEPYPARLVLSDENADLAFSRLSPDGSKMLYEARLEDRRIELRLMDLGTKKTSVIFQTALDYPPKYQLAPGWSPDGQKITFTDRASGNSDIFLMNADGSNLQNLTNETLADSMPMFSPDGNEIIFVRDFYGTGRLYRMNLDGSNQRLLTERQGYEMSPGFSPDGSQLAFAGDRNGLGLDIFQLDFKNPHNEKIISSRRLHDTQPTFSPDGNRLAFVSLSDGNAEIYLMNSNGTELFRLTHTKADESAPQFSLDGKKIIFSANRNGKYAIYEIDLP